MIKFTTNDNDIMSLWREAFGDSDEEIEFFIHNAKNAECLAYYKEKNIASMLYLVDCYVDEKKGKYIYAACTAERFRKLGIMSALLAYSRNFGYNFICLIPANESLIGYYEKRGFAKQISIDEIKFSQSPEIKEYLTEGFELSKPIALVCKGD